MISSRSFTLLVGAVLTALVLAGCGQREKAATAYTGAEPATIGVASTNLGNVLVDAEGRTLYLFEKDAATSSACAGACAGAWSPLPRSGEPTVGRGADAALITTAKRPDGVPQLAYNGHPLYLYAGDASPGDTHGHGLTDYGAAWYALTPEGEQVSAQPSSSDARQSSDGGS